MGKKPRKKRGRRRRRRKRSLALSLVVACVAAGLLAVAYLSLRPRPDAPVYEEARSDAAEAFPSVDRAIYGALYGSGMRERDIHYLSVQPKREHGRTWESAELHIDCPDRESVSKVSNCLDEALEGLGGGVEFRREAGPGDTIVYQVYSGGLPTHKLVLAPRFRGPPRPEAKPLVAIIIDDLGYDEKMARALMEVDLALTLSVLPYSPHARSVSREAARRGFELLLHLPMEPKEYPSVQPGEGALFLRMEEREIAATLDRDLSMVPGARGVNNHMGSGFTEDEKKMSMVLCHLKKRRLFFIDSRTSGQTKGFELAVKMGVPAAKRTIFLDNDVDPGAIRMQIGRLNGLARHAGSAIGIAHPYRETLQALRDSAERMAIEVDVVPVSELLR